MIYVKNIKLNNFRCFKSKSFDFLPNVNILIGKNGCGKTSVVEGISFLCLGKSFKGAKDKDVLKFDEEYFNIISNIVDKNENRIVVGYDGKQKRIKNGENICKTLSEHIGLYKLLSFCPDDLDIIKGSPSIRRQFIDVFISQCASIYLKALSEYKKVLKIRNDFLKNIINNKYDSIMFNVINEKLVESGKVIINLRKKYIEELNKQVEIVSKRLSNGQSIIRLIYNPDINDQDFENVIKSSINLDIANKITTHGPQKDDITILFDNKEASIYSSQGQIRMSVLSLKLSIYEIFSKENDNIIIILDDVFSELDENKQRYLMEYIENVGQVFITTTEIDKIPDELKQKSNIIEIKEGESNVWWTRKHYFWTKNRKQATS